MLESLIQTIAVAALPVIFAITLHEAAHGYAARYFGDPTAYQMGRISLNPVRHIDLVGTIIIPAAVLLFSGGTFLFGYAKPVPVDFNRLRNPKRDMFWVAAAGPVANLVMAIGWALSVRLALILPEFFGIPLARMAEKGIEINAVLLVLNLLPLPPLDGGRIAVSLLPQRTAWQYSRIEPWGMPIILLLLFTAPFRDYFFFPMIDAVKRIVFFSFGPF